jgi:hypothetical protein
MLPGLPDTADHALRFWSMPRAMPGDYRAFPMGVGIFGSAGVFVAWGDIIQSAAVRVYINQGAIPKKGGA